MSSLFLRRAVWRSFDATLPYERNATLMRHFRDLLDAFDLPLDERGYAAGRHNTYLDMSSALLAELLADGDVPDLILLAHMLPDENPAYCTCAYLSQRFGRDCPAFAVSDAGPIAPFVAFRIALAYARSGGATRPVVLALDQTTLPGGRPASLADGARDAGAALSLSTTSGCARIGDLMCEPLGDGAAIIDRVRATRRAVEATRTIVTERVPADLRTLLEPAIDAPCGLLSAAPFAALSDLCRAPLEGPVILVDVDVATETIHALELEPAAVCAAA